jgi:hypothetical protein
MASKVFRFPWLQTTPDDPPTHILMGTGTAGRLKTKRLLDTLEDFGQTSSILAAGIGEYNVENVVAIPITMPAGVQDISIPASEITFVGGFTGDEQKALDLKPDWWPSLHRMGDRGIAALARARISDGQIYLTTGYNAGHWVPSLELLRYYHVALPDAFITMDVVIPDEKNLRDKVAKDPFRFVRLQEERLCQVTLLTDNRSPLRQATDLPYQDTALATMWASLMSAGTTFQNQRHMVDVSHALQEQGALATARFASLNLVSPELDSPWPWRRKGDDDGWVTADPKNTIAMCRAAAKQVFTDPATQALEEPIDPRRISYLVFTLPLRASPASWRHIAESVKDALRPTYPNTVIIFAPGFGTPDPRFKAPTWMQAALLYPCRDMPDAIRRIIAEAEYPTTEAASLADLPMLELPPVRPNNASHQS